jgi:hypothetical protein
LIGKLETCFPVTNSLATAQRVDLSLDRQTRCVDGLVSVGSLVDFLR